jgi:hypothetical protein
MKYSRYEFLEGVPSGERDFLLANFEDLANIGMIERGGRHRLTAETFLCLSVSCQGGRQQLNGDLTIEPWVSRLEHHSHTALPDWGKDLVGTKASSGS